MARNNDNSLTILRRAIYAGVLYEKDVKLLSDQIETWFESVEEFHGPARAIIAPHSNFDTFGLCAAQAYKQININQIERFIILGPSHKTAILGCCVSKSKNYATPFYNVPVDRAFIKELKDTRLFSDLDASTEQGEYSIEMQLPFIAKIMQDYKDSYTIVPILVGVLPYEMIDPYVKIFKKLLLDERNCLIISTDLCHWGEKHGFTSWNHHDERDINSFVHSLDQKCMEVIEDLNPFQFIDYIRETSNTICGTNVLVLFLFTIHQYCLTVGAKQANFRFLDYRQSGKALSEHDECISGAAGSLVLSDEAVARTTLKDHYYYCVE